MKKLFQICIFLLLSVSTAYAQGNNSKFYDARTAYGRFLLVYEGDSSVVYKHTWALDKAGQGPLFKERIVLPKADSIVYTADGYKITKERDGVYINRSRKKNKKKKFEVLSDSVATLELNHAYFLHVYLDSFIQLYNDYSVYYNHWINAFYKWDNVQDKYQNYLLFQKYVDSFVAEECDAIRFIEERYIANMQYVLDNIDSISYEEVKERSDVLIKGDSPHRYFNVVVKELSIKQPEYYVRLAQDYPNNYVQILLARDGSKETQRRLKATPGYKELMQKYRSSSKQH